MTHGVRDIWMPYWDRDVQMTYSVREIWMMRWVCCKKNIWIDLLSSVFYLDDSWSSFYLDASFCWWHSDDLFGSCNLDEALSSWHLDGSAWYVDASFSLWHFDDSSGSWDLDASSSLWHLDAYLSDIHSLCELTRWVFNQYWITFWGGKINFSTKASKFKRCSHRVGCNVTLIWHDAVSPNRFSEHMCAFFLIACAFIYIYSFSIFCTIVYY